MADTKVSDLTVGNPLTVTDEFHVARAGTDRACTLATLPVGVAVGDCLIFPATQSASADANALDDYEEGTFTPGIAFGGGVVGLTYSSQAGTYTKVGDRVCVSAVFALTSNGTSTGNATLTGLPFTAAASGAWPLTSRVNGLTSIAGQFQVSVNASATTAGLSYSQTGTTANVTEANVSDTASFQFNGVYKV